jgi:hypothetical protein
MSNPEQVILITGARDWTDRELIRDTLMTYEGKRVLLIHGDCRGADRLSGQVAQELKFEVLIYRPDWATYGRAAGPIRNREMIKKAVALQREGVDTTVLAFHDNWELSRGTRNCVEQAEKAGLIVIRYGGEGASCSQ